MSNLPNDPYSGFQLDPRISASNNWGMGDDPTLSGAIGNYLIRNVPSWARGAAGFFNPSRQSSITNAQSRPLGGVFSGLRPQPLPATPVQPALVGATAPLATPGGGESPIVQPPVTAPSSSPPQGPLAASAAPAPQPQPQPPGTTLTSLPPFTPPATGTMGYPAAGVGGQHAPMMGYPAAGVGTGAGWGGPDQGGRPTLTPAPRVQGQTSQNAPPTNPNSPRGTNQATPSSQAQPTTGYYTPTTGIGRGPGTWHPGSIADAIHNAGVGIGQHLDQTFGVTRPAGYYDYRSQGQPTYNGPLSQPVVNNMGGRVNQAGINTAPLQPATNLPASYQLPSGMRMTPQGDVIGQPKQGWQGWS